MYKQVKGFNQAIAGKTPGYCLRNVRLGYGIASKYPTAIAAWNGLPISHKHRDRNVPSGVDVPLYYTYKTDGHINVRLANGKVWSDGVIFNSIADYEAKKEPNFIGWGESVNGVSVIQYVPDPAPAPPVSKMPPVGSRIQLFAPQTRTTWKAGTTQKAGEIRVTDNTFVYTVRGYDPRYTGRILINTKSGGGDGVALALYYVNGSLIEGWKRI